MSSSGSSTPTLCANNCGFYGSPGNRNLCSQCYRKEAIVLSESHGIDSVTSSMKPVSLHNENDHVIDDTSMAKKKSSRCLCCKKKIGLLGFACRCGGEFCSKHRYPEEHSCPFDYKTTGRIALARENPLVTHDRLADRL